MLRDAWTVAAKELRDLFRDRRTLMFAVVLPLVLTPLLMHLSIWFMADEANSAEHKTAQIAVYGDALPADAVAALQGARFDARAEEHFDRDAVHEAIRNDELDAAIVVRNGAADQLQLTVYYDNSGFGGSTIVERLDDALEPYRAQIQRQKLAAVGVSTPEALAAVLEPVPLEKVGLASLREAMGTAVGAMLPYLFMFLAFLGAQWPANDLGAGEKERGTLEALLLAPISRTSLVLGKFTAVTVFATTTALAGLAGIGIGVAMQMDGDGGGSLQVIVGSFSAIDIVLCALLLVPLTITIAALLLSASFYARSFKETQSLSSALIMPLAILVMIAQAPQIELDAKWAFVPVTNVSLAIKEIIKGTADPGLIALVVVASGLMAAALLAFCVRWFQRESVLFRS